MIGLGIVGLAVALLLVLCLIISASSVSVAAALLLICVVVTLIAVAAVRVGAEGRPGRGADAGPYCLRCGRVGPRTQACTRLDCLVQRGAP